MNGKDRYLVLKNVVVPPAPGLRNQTVRPEQWLSAGVPAGWSLSIGRNGLGDFSVRTPTDGRALSTTHRLNDGQWHHLIAEADRKANPLTIFVDGKRDNAGAGVGGDSLANDAELFLGGTPEGRHLACVLDFMHLSRGTLADARTTVDEWYAWQVRGPFLRDFVGRPRVPGKAAAWALAKP